MAAYRQKMCKSCFTKNGFLHRLQENMELRSAYEAITGLPLSNEDSSPYLCNNCAGLIMHSMRLKKIASQQRVIYERHGNVSDEFIQSLVTTTHSDKAIGGTKKEKTSDIPEIGIKHEDIPANPIAAELCEKIKTENIPKETNVKEDVFDEGSVSKNVDDSELTKGKDGSTDDGLPPGQEKKKA